MQVTAAQLAKILQGTVEGDPETSVDRPSKIEEGGAGSISFLGNPKYEAHLYTTTASIVIIPLDFALKEATTATLIRVADVYQSLGILLKNFENNDTVAAGIDSMAFVHPTATVDPTASIGAFAYVGEGASIGKNSVISPQVFVGQNVKIGEDCLLQSGVKLYATVIQDRCIIHSNTVIGSDGFGFNPRPDGQYDKIPQVGNVIIESDVEIGANTVIDRASIGHTVIRKGTKLDNLIQIAHNVEIGQNTVIAAQAGIAGSTKIGDSCRIGGQAGFVGHIQVANGTMVQAQSGVAQAVKEPNQAFYGSPAIGYRDYLKSYAGFKQLPELIKRIKQLESKVKDLEGQ